MRRERRIIDISFSSGATNPRVIFWERVEVREAVFNDEGNRAQKESDIESTSGEIKRKQIERNVVCEWTINIKGKTRDPQQ